jgi:hypothetical protein
MRLIWHLIAWPLACVGAVAVAVGGACIWLASAMVDG